jgi:aspartate/methionine/tyrosine aminotransferase
MAQELNNRIAANAPTTYDLLSDFGRRIYMPQGIVAQGSEAKAKAHRYNATIGIAKQDQGPMFLDSALEYFNILAPEDLFEYAPPTGLPALRQIWQEKILADNTQLEGEAAISLPVVTHAMTNGLMLTADLFLNPGETLIIPDKFWGNYRLLFGTRYGAEIVHYALFDDALSGFNVDGLDAALAQTDAPKIALLFNFPNNPTGYTPTVEEAQEIVETIRRYADQGKQILIISDDAYYGLQYQDGLIEGSIFEHFAGAHPNIVAAKVDGFTKEFYVWGFRVGFLTFANAEADAGVYAALETKTGAAIRSSISSCSRPAQSILLDMMQGEAYKRERVAKYKVLKARADRVREVAYDPQYADCWEVYPFNSGYFMCVRLRDASSEAVRQQALNAHGVGTIAIGETDLRIAFSCIDLEEIPDIFRLLAQSVRELRRA